MYNKNMDVFKNFNVTIYRGELKNGIKIKLFYHPGAPITTTAVLNSGSKYDPENMQGIAHFLEHMIVNGSLELPSKDLLAEHIESVGGNFSASTGQDFISINTEVSGKEDYSRVRDIINAILCSPLMDKRVFENEKQIIIKEIYKNDSNPNQILVKTARKLFFKDTPFEHEILGNEESISKLSYEDMISEYGKLFDKSRITFVVSGDISIEEVTFYLNNLAFLNGNNFNNTSDEIETSDKEKILTAYFDTPQTYICFGVLSPNF